LVGYGNGFSKVRVPDVIVLAGVETSVGERTCGGLPTPESLNLQSPI